jgi:adenylyltransferase/sulfurtransferase
MPSITVIPEDSKNDRFHRFKLISWWKQEKLSKAKVLVVGAGALGNEIIKNLALLGIGNLFIADFDTIENSNLSRSILFREKDNGQSKAITASKAAKDIYPGIKTHSSVCNAISDLGLGVFLWADVIICGLDSREARLGINRAAHKVKKPWIDGAIEGLNGIARVFMPTDGPCYECTMNKQDWKLLQSRRACNLLTKEEILEGKTPTTPTIASIIAGIQCQELVKMLHSMEHLQGEGVVFNGLTNDSYIVEYKRKKDCYSHYSFPSIVSLNKRTDEITVKYLFDLFKNRLSSNSITIELNNEYLNEICCPNCSHSKVVFIPIDKVKKNDLICEKCGEESQFDTVTSIYGDEDFIDNSFNDIGVPPFDIIVIRSENESTAVMFSGDAESTLGELSE